MTSPPDPSPSPAALAGSLAALAQQVAGLRRRLDTLERRAVAAGLDQHAASLAEIRARLDELSGTLTAALDAAAPKGPPAPRWDNVDPADRARELTRLQTWVTKILDPHYCQGGAYTLPRCWASHPASLWELGTLAAQWRRIYDRERPSLDLALEFYHQWLPSVMAHLADMTRHCTAGCTAARHRQYPGLH